MALFFTQVLRHTSQELTTLHAPKNVQLFTYILGLIAECISSEATNLVKHMLGWEGVATTSVPLRNAIKGVACAQNIHPI